MFAIENVAVQDFCSKTIFIFIYVFYLFYFIYFFFFFWYANYLGWRKYIKVEGKIRVEWKKINLYQSIRMESENKNAGKIFD